MKSHHNSLGFALIFGFVFFCCFLGIGSKSIAQGFNDNEWIFGSCGTGDNSYLSFGKGTTANVQTLPGSILIGRNNNALAIDPITGQPLFYTNGELVYDYSGRPIQGMESGLNGDIDGRQKVATGFLEYDPEGEKLFYIFYISPGGQLQYSIVDMNAPGQATGNEPPLGEVTQKDVPIGLASGAILVVKTPSSPSYLISFNGGNLEAREIGTASGEFTPTNNVAIPSTPKGIVFDEANNRLLIIPEGTGEDILVVPFDPNSGNFGTPSPISQSSGSGEFGGAEFSPDGNYIYFSRGNQLFRVPTADLNATPEEIPLTTGLNQVYDIKVGPDGQLYYIYEETAGGPQLIGRVTNPNEPDLALLVLEEDPFAGTDFCGTVFPIFAPNISIEPEVDFTWQPDEPCANNPVQLTSEITPENYQPVSFNWEFNPPLTDSDGNPLPADYNQEHFLVPQDAAQGSSISVTLTVEFADGTTIIENKTIPLAPNNLEANFTPSDTTICESCIDLDPLLQAQAGGGGGEAPPSGGGSSYEYFWSNKRDEGWIAKGPNEVCRPGLYWVLVREPGSSCYAYAEIRIRMWDVPDQTNNIWYFGDGAGLDFNPDPDDPNAPTPRPIAERHPQNIPAGTTTISDQAGQVLFFTDGESVWDLNGDLMANGDGIGGNNTASQGVIAIPVPTEPTLFYLFTTQSSAGGSNTVSFSLVDIKSENETGVGNVVSKNNFLFSPSTEHSAALTAGDTTWVLFHELGNNTFRAYPVTVNGIGQPVFSSVGSTHGFNSGVGAMKFSPDGDKVAVTISEGGCNRVEIFDFDQSTGELTEYARLDLGCDGDVYGLEFSEEGDRVLVSYRNGGPGIEEFIIEPVDNNDPDAATCPSCFEGATSRADREACILTTRNTVSDTAGLNLGALQIASDGQIYVAVVGDDQIGQIQVGTGCTGTSSFNQNAVAPMPGTSNLGLPSFVQNSGSSIPEPALAVPPRLCLDPALGASALLEGGGEPDIDSYFWTITHEDGTVIRNEFGGPGDEFQTLDQIFNRPGIYTVDLRVDRCAEIGYFTATSEIEVVGPPELTLAADVTLCAGTPVTLTAIDGYDPAEGLYDFQWTNAAGQVFGDQNSNSITVDQESIYTVQVSYRVPAGLSVEEAALFETCPSTAEVFVGPAFEFDLTQTATEVCYEETSVTFAPDTPLAGEWFYELGGSGTRVPLGEFFELELFINTLPSAGLYTIYFVVEDPILEGCTIEKTLQLLVNELPIFIPTQTNPATDCATADGGFEILMQADAAEVRIPELSQTFPPVNAGEVIPVPDLLPGVYTIEAESAAGCFYSGSVTVENANPPAAYAFSVTPTDETCAAVGVNPGSITITLDEGVVTGTYSIVRQEDGLTFSDSLPATPSFTVDVTYGDYLVEIRDLAGCVVPDPTTYTIGQKFEVVFSVPTEVEACEVFTFAPTGPNPLNYTVTNSSGTVINPDSNGDYTLTANGIYTVRGEDPNGVDCPREIQMNVNLSRPIDFAVSPPIVDCDAGVRFDAILTGVDPADVLFLWKDELGVIVGRRQSFVPARDGNYTLEVQPISGGLCITPPQSFSAEILEQSVTVSLVADPYCLGETSTVIDVVADLTNVAEIIWFRSSGGTPTRINTPPLQQSLTVTEPGTYEVLLNSSPATGSCILGRANVVVAQSTIIDPVVPTEPITICAVEGINTSIDPGDYDNYSWILNGEEVSQDAVFTPTLPGEYELRVSDNLGCEYVATFTILEDCRLRIVYPNAIVLDDPDRNFILYANEFIDDVEVFIFNRWGELIFYCSHEYVEPRQPYCPWDGRVNGNFVPNGTYAVKVKFTSRNQNKTQTETKAITIIQ